jgi:hypothetical protein
LILIVVFFINLVFEIKYLKCHRRKNMSFVKGLGMF